MAAAFSGSSTNLSSELEGENDPPLPPPPPSRGPVPVQHPDQLITNMKRTTAMARQPKAMQRYQRGRSRKFIMAASDPLRATIDAARAMLEDKVAQRVSYPVVIWKACQVLQEHLLGATSITERDALLDLIARGEVSERETPAGPELRINMGRLIAAADLAERAHAA